MSKDEEIVKPLDTFRYQSTPNKSIEFSQTQEDLSWCPDYTTCFCSGVCQRERLKAIAQNGNIGYGDVYDRVERDYAKD